MPTEASTRPARPGPLAARRAGQILPPLPALTASVLVPILAAAKARPDTEVDNLTALVLGGATIRLRSVGSVFGVPVTLNVSSFKASDGWVGLTTGGAAAEPLTVMQHGTPNTYYLGFASDPCKFVTWVTGYTTYPNRVVQQPCPASGKPPCPYWPVTTAQAYDPATGCAKERGRTTPSGERITDPDTPLFLHWFRVEWSSALAEGNIVRGTLLWFCNGGVGADKGVGGVRNDVLNQGALASENNRSKPDAAYRFEYEILSYGVPLLQKYIAASPIDQFFCCQGVSDGALKDADPARRDAACGVLNPTDFPTQCSVVSAGYCAQGTNMESDYCFNAARRRPTPEFDAAMVTYCEAKGITIENIGEPQWGGRPREICGCHLDSEAYVNLYKALQAKYPQIAKITSLGPAQCLLPECASSLLHPVGLGSCPSIQCLQAVSINNAGTITGDITINQEVAQCSAATVGGKCKAKEECGAGQLCISGTCQAETTPTPPPPPPPTTCTTDTNCPAGQVCTANKCVPKPCTTNTDCPAGQTCTSGKCQAAVVPTGTCTSDTQCPPGQRCVAGRCQATTTPTSCTSDANCPSGQRCVSGKCQTVPPPTPTHGLPTGAIIGIVVGGILLLALLGLLLARGRKRKPKAPATAASPQPTAALLPAGTYNPALYNPALGATGPPIGGGR